MICRIFLSSRNVFIAAIRVPSSRWHFMAVMREAAFTCLEEMTVSMRSCANGNISEFIYTKVLPEKESARKQSTKKQRGRSDMFARWLAQMDSSNKVKAMDGRLGGCACGKCVNSVLSNVAVPLLLWEDGLQRWKAKQHKFRNISGSGFLSLSHISTFLSTRYEFS